LTDEEFVTENRRVLVIERTVSPGGSTGWFRIADGREPKRGHDVSLWRQQLFAGHRSNE
jgi:hypothetical protein